MAFKKSFGAVLVAILTIALVISVSPLTAFAADEDVTDTVIEETSSVVTDAVIEETSSVETEVVEEPVVVDTAEVAADTNDVSEASTDTVSAAENESGADTSADTTADTTETATEVVEEEKSGIKTSTIVSLAIVLVIVISIVVYCVKNKEKVAKFFREVKSELKKIVWTPWNQVKKNTLVVLIIIVICAAAIGAIDYLFSKGIFALGNLF